MKNQALLVSRASDKFMLRFPAGMRDRVRELAEQKRRSMNSEILHLIELGLDAEVEREAKLG